MTPVKQWQLAGVAALAASLLLVEFLAHQLIAAVLSPALALLVVLAVPTLTAVGAAAAARTARNHNPFQLLKTAAHTALAGGFALVATVVAVTWSSRRIAKAKGATEWADLAALSLGWLVTAGLLGAAIALVLRASRQRLGRAVFSSAVGSALAALALPQLLTLRAPHLTLLVPGLVAVGALLIGYAGRSARPHWASLSTLPLVVLALYAGDKGAPWVKVRTDIGRHSQVDHHEWTTDGLISVNRVRHGKSSFTVGNSPKIPFGVKPKGKQKPPFEHQDLIYHLTPKKRGEVLVIGSLGGREVAAANAYGHKQLSAIMPQGRVLNKLLLDKYAVFTGPILHQPGEVALSVGDGRASLQPFWGRFQYVVVMANSNLRQTPPRLLSHSDRAYSVEAQIGYLTCLDPIADGALLVHVREPSQLPSIIASSLEAMRPRSNNPADHIAVCGGDDHAAVMMTLQPLDNKLRRTLRQRCRRGRMELLYPPPPQLRGNLSGQRESKIQTEARRLLSGTPLHDAMPFLDPPPAPQQLTALAGEALKDLRPADPTKLEKAKKAAANKAKAELRKQQAVAAKKGAKANNGAKAKSGKAKKAALPAPLPKPEVHELGELARASGIATAATLFACLVALLLMVLLPSRRDSPMSGSVRLAMPLFGIASAVVLFTLGEVTLNALGSRAYAWSMVIPLGMLGWGAGGLSADVPRYQGQRGALVRLGALGVVVLLLAALLAGPVGLLNRLAMSGTVVAGAALLLVAGGALGSLPVMTAKLMGDGNDAAVAWSWAAHGAGWAIGSAASFVAVHYLQTQRLMFVGIVFYAAAATLLAAAMRGARSPR